MQRHLLPARLPVVDGLEFASRYVADGDGEVGGDWYDVFALPSGGVCLVVGDVVGHGLAAAEAMSEIRAVLRAYTSETEDPAVLLSKVDQHVRRFHLATMATVLCAVLPRSSDLLHISAAGHPPPILADPKRGALTVPVPADVPVGVTQDTPRRMTEVPLAPGSVLCMYTDGLVERRNTLIDDNIEKLRKAVTPKAAELVCVDVMSKLVGAATPGDDIAVLIVRRLPDGADCRTPQSA